MYMPVNILYRMLRDMYARVTGLFLNFSLN